MSIETVLILAAISLPVLIFLVRVVWPKIKGMYDKGINELEGGSAGAETVPDA